jgi:ankyrin repeat protein
LHYANAYKFSKIVDSLLEFGADEYLKNNAGKTPWEGL